jgi:hypothetical protein
MIDLLRQRATLVLFLLLCSAGSLNSILSVRDWGNRLSRVDADSEANTLREVRHFLEDGPGKYYGLGNINYPGMYPDDGITEASLDGPYGNAAETRYVRNHVLTPEGVYTHYPPGPEYLTYAAAKLLGPEPVSRLRLLSIAVGWAAMIFLGLAVRRRFGPMAGWLVMAALAVTPAVTDVYVGLHYEGYALALMLCELGIAIGLGTASIPFAVLGFLQGWLSFDYVFLICLAPLLIETVMPRIDAGYQSRWRLGWRRTALTAAGFCFAHILHFAQVWAFWGSFSAAFNDILGAASYRAGAAEGILGHMRSAVQLLNNYYVGEHPLSPYVFPVADEWSPAWVTFRFLGLALGPWWIIVTMVLAFRQFRSGTDAARTLADDWLRISLPAILVSSSWFMVMVNHGLFHQPIIYRHLCLGFFVCILFGAVKVSRRLTEVPVLQPAA